MSETTTEAPATEKPAGPVFKDELQRLQFGLIEDMIVERNGNVGKANAAHGDRQSLTEQIRENDTDPEIVKAREQMSMWSEKLNDLVKPKVEAVIADAAGSVEGIEAKIKEIDSKLKPGLNYYKKLYADDTVDYFTPQSRLVGTAVRSGAGGRRIRGYNLTVTVDGEDRTFENFTQAAKHLDIETSDLQAAFFAAAGTEDAKSLPPDVKFVINYTETDADENEVAKDAQVHAFAVKQDDAASATASDESDSNVNTNVSADTDADGSDEPSDPFEDEDN